MKRLLLVLFIGGWTLQASAQTVNLSMSHNLGGPTTYVVDFMKLDSTMFWSLKLPISDIKYVYARSRDGTLFILTELPVIIDEKLLLTRKQKRSGYSFRNPKEIESIMRMEAEQAVQQYGKRGKRGVLVVKLIE